MTDLKDIHDAVTYLLDLVDPSDGLYVAEPDSESAGDLHDHIIEALEAMQSHIESGNPVPRSKESADAED
jgi:hypothetical protein